MRLLHKKVLDSFHAASKDATQYHLNGILVAVDEGRVNIVACDGHILSVINMECPELGSGEYFVPREDMVKLKALGDEYIFRKSDVKYPRWQQLIPTTPEDGYKCGETAVNLHLLGRLSKVLGNRKTAGVRVKIKDNSSPILMEHSNEEYTATMVVMPMRL